MPANRDIELALVLAGGLGTRLRSVVSDRPKPMAIVNGRPFLEYLLDYLISEGIKRVVICIGYMGTQISDHFGIIYKDIEITYQSEGDPRGTGGALVDAVKQLEISEPFILLNGDTYFPVSIASLSAVRDLAAAHLVFAMFRSDDCARFKMLELNKMNSIVSYQALDKPSIRDGYEIGANGGVYLIDPSIFDSLKVDTECVVSFEESIIPAVGLSGAILAGMIFEDVFIDIGLPADYSRANSSAKKIFCHEDNVKSN